MVRQLTPQGAVERYLQERKGDLSDSTIYNYRSNLSLFTDWCACQSDIQHVSDIDQFTITDFKMYKREQEVADTTLYNVMMALRTFIKWCESKGLLDGISESIMLPDQGRAAKTETIEPERAEEILDYLKHYEYATTNHVTFALMWDTGMRIGAVRALDLDDYVEIEEYVKLRHRPGPGDGDSLSKNRGTPLKNGRDSERQVNLHGWVAEIVSDYIEARRKAVTDDLGRQPLITTSQGRPARSTYRRWINCITRPCYYSDECPVGREISDCEATKWEHAAKCPESVPPHAIRRSSITAWLDEGHQKELISDRMDVSTEVIEEHYDQRSEEQKRKLREELFDMD